MSKLKVNEIETYNVSKIIVSSPIELGAGSHITAATGTTTINLTNIDDIDIPAGLISGDAISGGTQTNFKCTGINDNAGSTVITLNTSEDMILTGDSNLTLSGTGTVTTVDLTASGTTLLGATTSINSVRVQALVPRAWWNGSMTIAYNSDEQPTIFAIAENSTGTSRYGTAIPGTATTTTTADSMKFVYSDAAILDGLESSALVTIYGDPDLVRPLPFNILYTDISFTIHFLVPTTDAADYDSKTYTAKMSVTVMSLPN